jgi:hypothetical protein
VRVLRFNAFVHLWFLAVPALAVEVPVLVTPSTAENSTGYYGGLFFGQSRSRGPEDPVTAFRLGVGRFYDRKIDSWARSNAGFEVFYGQMGHSRTTLNGAGIVGKMAYLRSIHSTLYAEWGVGGGLMYATPTTEAYEDVTEIEESPSLGNLLEASYMLKSYGTSGPTMFGGLLLTYANFNLSQKLTTPQGKVSKNTPVNLLIPQLGFGMMF